MDKRLKLIKKILPTETSQTTFPVQEHLWPIIIKTVDELISSCAFFCMSFCSFCFLNAFFYINLNRSFLILPLFPLELLVPLEILVRFLVRFLVLVKLLLCAILTKRQNFNLTLSLAPILLLFILIPFFSCCLVWLYVINGMKSFTEITTE